MKKKVDFIGIGAPKSATSWIYECLKSNPDVCVSNIKETHYFSRNYSKGDEFYLKYYDCSGDKIMGEFSNTYMYNADVPRRIKTHNENVKLIVCLRHPIERAISHYYFLKARLAINFNNINKVIQGDIRGNKSENKFKAIERGRYYKYLKNFYKLFDKDNIFILFYDDIKQNPKKSIDELFKFLKVGNNVDSLVLLNEVNVTPASSYKIKFLSAFYIWAVKYLNNNFINRGIKKVLKFFRVNKLIVSILKYNFKEKKLVKVKKQDINNKTRKDMIDFYRDDVVLLNKEIKKVPSGWSEFLN